MAAALMKERYFDGAYTRSQLEAGELPPSAIGRKYAHSYSPYGGARIHTLLPHIGSE